MSAHHDEMTFLEDKTRTYITSKYSWDRAIKKYALDNFLPYMTRKGSALEFGCYDGYMTSHISCHVQHLTVVEGSKTFIDMARQVAPDNVTFIHSLFENYFPNTRFDYIFATFVMEHVSNPIEFLRHAGNLLKENGFLYLVVPNAQSLSRQLACHMGLLNEPFELTPNDLNHGHRRVYDRLTLNRDIASSGLQQVSQGGLMLKPFADFQMDLMIDNNILGETQLEGLYKLGFLYSDFASSLFSVCKLPDSENRGYHD